METSYININEIRNYVNCVVNYDYMSKEAYEGSHKLLIKYIKYLLDQVKQQVY